MLDLARVAALHEAALAAGLPGVLQKDYTCGSGHWGMWLEDPYGDEIHPKAAQAAVAWWLREWCQTMRNPNVGPFDGKHYLMWAEEIVANHKENT